MLEAISDRLQKVFKTLRGEGHLTEKHVDDALAEIRRALLGADVALPVVKEFTAKVRERALGKDVLASLSPAQQVLKIVHEELTSPARRRGAAAQVQGVSRPAPARRAAGHRQDDDGREAGRVHQADARQARRSWSRRTRSVPPRASSSSSSGRSAGCRCSTPGRGRRRPRSPARRSSRRAARGSRCILFDTAGRLHVDEELMAELTELNGILKPSEVLFVADAMTGQDAVRQAEAFSARLPLTGVILTKLDGDARGGAALSVVSVSGKPIRLVGVGERLEDIELFHPDRMAARILGLGDMQTFFEKAQAVVDEKTAAEMEKKLKKQSFDLDDLRDQLKQMRGGGLLEPARGSAPRSQGASRARPRWTTRSWCASRRSSAR